MPKKAECPSETWPAYPPATFQAPETAPHMRIRIRLSRKKPSRIASGAAADAPKTKAARAWRRIGACASDAEGFGAALAEEPGGTEYQHCDEEDEIDDFLPGRAEDVGADDLHGGDDEAAQERAHHVAEAS